jgi:hypothetical protein
VAQQLSLSPEVINDYKWDGRTIKKHRRQIRTWLGFHLATVDDQKALRNWLIEEVLPHEHRPVYLEQLAYQQLRQLQIEPPTRGRMERLVSSALHQYEQAFFADTAARLPNIVKVKLRQLIYRREALTTDIDLEKPDDDNPSYYPIHDLKSKAGAAKVKNIKKAAGRLKLLQQVELPDGLFSDIPLGFLRQYQQQAAVESISHLQRHRNEAQTYTLLAAFCWVRRREITDQLVDLFIQVLNDIRHLNKRCKLSTILCPAIRRWKSCPSQAAGFG